MTTSANAYERERRRKRAVRAVREGQSPATVAKALGVHRGSICRWFRMAHKPGGLGPIPLRRPLAPFGEHFRSLEALLLEGTSRHG